jgi:hypothetical protein
MLHGDGDKFVAPHVTQSSQRGISTWELYAASTIADYETIKAWSGKNHPNHDEIVQAIAEIKCYVATCKEEKK